MAVHMTDQRSDAEILVEMDRLLSEVQTETDRDRILIFLISKHAPGLQSAKPTGRSVNANKPRSLPAEEENDEVDVENANDDSSEFLAIGPKAKRWLENADLPRAKLETLFERVGKEVHLIAPKMAQGTQTKRTQAVYLLEGVRAFLQSDVPTINNDTARKLCQDYSCYNKGNHNTFVNGLKGSMRGDKTSGYLLTTPGLTEAAQLISTFGDSTKPKSS